MKVDPVTLARHRRDPASEATARLARTRAASSFRDALTRWPHLTAGALVLLIGSALLGGGVLAARVLEDRYVRSLAPRSFKYRAQLSALQAAALRQPDLLLVYGSSEFAGKHPLNPTDLFRTYPTGFTVYAVGKGGKTSLVLLQDLAGLGSAVRGKRVVISLSPSWFYAQLVPDAEYYAGNFSALQAYALVFSSTLRVELRQVAARRMLQYPATLANDPLLALALEALARGTLADRGLYAVLWPLGKLRESILRAQDHWEAVSLIVGTSGLADRVPRVPATLDWPALLADAERLARREATRRTAPFRSTFSTEKLQESLEWTDLELLLEGLEKLGARPLIISMPIAGTFYETVGVSRDVRYELYYQRLRRLVERYRFPLVDFLDQDEQADFLEGIGGHPSPKGWVHYDRILDRFYHGALDP